MLTVLLNACTVLELAPACLCEAGLNPLSVMTMLNCLGYMCFDSMRQSSSNHRSTTRKYTKHANPGERPCSCGGTPYGRGAPDRTSFESWANSVVGYTDLICAKPKDAHLVKAGPLRCKGTVPVGIHEGKDCNKARHRIEKCPIAWCSTVGCSIESDAKAPG